MPSKRQEKKKNELGNEEEEENKGFHIDGNKAKFLEHLDQHTRFISEHERNIRPKFPIIYKSLPTVKSFSSLLGKTIKKIPHKIDPIYGEITLNARDAFYIVPKTGT